MLEFFRSREPLLKENEEHEKVSAVDEVITTPDPLDDALIFSAPENQVFDESFEVDSLDFSHIKEAVEEIEEEIAFRENDRKMELIVEKERDSKRIRELSESIEGLNGQIVSNEIEIEMRNKSLCMVSSEISQTLRNLNQEIKKTTHTYIDERLVATKALELDQNYLELEEVFSVFKTKVRLIRGPIGEAMAHIVDELGGLLSENGMQARELYALVADNIDSHVKRESNYQEFIDKIQRLQSKVLDLAMESDKDE